MQHKDRILKAVSGKQQINYKANLISPIADF